MTAVHPYASHAPVFSIDGARKGELARDLLRLDVEEDIFGLRTFVGHFNAVGPASDGSTEQLLYLDGTIADFGKELALTLGPPQGERRIFTGKISALKAAFGEGRVPTVTVFAEDDLMVLRMTRRARTYDNVSDADLARAIASEHGLSADVQVDGPTYPLVQQWNQSDLAFLRDRARLVEAEVWIDDSTLHFTSRARRRGPNVTLVQGNQLIAVTLRADLAHQRSSVIVSGFDAAQRERIEETAGSDTINAEISGGRTGPAVLTASLGERPTQRVRDTPVARNEATAWAKAEMLRRCRSFVTVEGETAGTPDMSVGARLTLERVGKPFEGSGYAVVSVRHSYDLDHGHRTHFTAERPTINER